MKTPQEIMTKWSENASRAGDSYEAGIRAIPENENPLAKAAAAEEKWRAGCDAAAKAKRFSKGLNKISFADWKKHTIEVGRGRYTTGVASAKAKAKYLAFMVKFKPFVEQLVSTLPKKGDIEDSVKRAAHMIRGLKKFSNDSGN